MHERRKGIRWRGASGAIPVPDEVLAGRLVEASRVPACISKDSALCAPGSVVWDEGLRCRNMERKRVETGQEIAHLLEDRVEDPGIRTLGFFPRCKGFHGLLEGDLHPSILSPAHR